jgi:replicative DNA helicase
VADHFADRLPPHNRDAERAVIGSMLRENIVINDVVQIIRTEDFYFDVHQKFFAAIVELCNEASPADLVTVWERLRQKGQEADVGGVSYIAEVWDGVPTAANAVYYAKIVKDCSLVRGLIHVSNETLRDAYDRMAPATELVETAERRVMEIAQMGLAGTTVSIREAMTETSNLIDARMARGALLPGVPSGYTDLDAKTSGFRNSELTILAARPGVGKTCLALNFLRNAAVQYHEPVFFVSLEMSKTELCERLISCHSKVDSYKIRMGRIDTNEVDKMVDALGVFSSTGVFIDDTACQGMTRIAANARRLKMRHNIKMVIIDYIQLIEPENKREPRHEQVGHISRRLKFLAKELDIPVIALSQLNRNSEDREGHKPRLADLRESGNLEQDADNVFLMYRPGMYDTSDDPAIQNVVEINIAKQRSGPTGEITLTYIKQFMRFENHIPDFGNHTAPVNRGFGAGVAGD